MKQIKYYGEIASPFNLGKVFLHREKIEQLLAGEIPLPTTAEIDLTTGVCNFRCPHCCFKTYQKHKKHFFKEKDFYSLISDFTALGIKGIEFVGGGEPTMHPQIADFISFVHKSGLQVGLATNGSFLEKIFPVASCLTWARVSLDAATSETYALVHGVNQKIFKEIIKKVKKLISLAPTDVFGVGFLMVPNNLQEIKSAALLAKKLKARYFQVRPAICLKWTPEQISFAEEQTMEAVKLADENFQVFFRRLGWKHLCQKRRYEHCLSSSLTTVIEADGNVSLCNLKRGQPEWSLGNLRKNSFKEIWFSARHRQLINKIKLRDCPPYCKHDFYNIAIESLRDGYLHENFL